MEQYPFLIPLLQAAPTKIREYFPKSGLTLEVFTFQDEAAGERLLVAGVTPAASCEPEEAVETMNELGFEWWLNTSEQAQGKLEIFLRWQ